MCAAFTALNAAHLHVKGLILLRLPRGLCGLVRLSAAGHYSKCVIIHLDHKLAITLAYAVIIWREHCSGGKKAACVNAKHCAALYVKETTC